LGCTRYLVAGAQRDGHGLGEVEQFAGLAEERGGVAEVGVDALGGARLAAGEQGAGMGDLVSVARCRDPGADVEELPDPRRATSMPVGTVA
jgi:hypothetical protein